MQYFYNALTALLFIIFSSRECSSDFKLVDVGFWDLENLTRFTVSEMLSQQIRQGVIVLPSTPYVYILSPVKSNYLKLCTILIHHFCQSITLSSTTTAGTTTMLKCFDTLPCGGLGVSQFFVLYLFLRFK